jgi:hypothetical protein
MTHAETVCKKHEKSARCKRRQLGSFFVCLGSFFVCLGMGVPSCHSWCLAHLFLYYPWCFTPLCGGEGVSE